MPENMEKTDHPLRILIVASEAVPYAKVGGLGDVAGILPRIFAERGHDVRLVVPLYASIDRDSFGIFPLLEPMGVPMGTGTAWCGVHACRAPGGYEIHFIEHHDFFSRPGIYDEGGVGYADNGTRYLFFSRAVLQDCIDTGFSPHVIHCHDWMTAAVPAYLKYHMTDNPLLGYTGSLLTIHNIGMGYQGLCPESDFVYSGLPWEAFNSMEFEALGWTNLLKGGIANADIINAVSPSFAREILGHPGGGGLDEFLRRRQHDLHGILNGVDYDSWNPETDPMIPANYSTDDLSGKAECKRVLQQAFGLHEDPFAPLLGVVSRMNAQKGLDLVAQALPSLIERGAQFVIVGTGDGELESTFMNLPARYPGRAGSWIGFSNDRAHLVEAGSDMFLMPSRWEPCGLNQMYSLRYGTLPVVRATGGLDDTVENYDPGSGSGTGFKFGELSARALRDTTAWAMEVYWNRSHHWHDMMLRAMHKRFTWQRAALEYEQLYHWSIAKRKHWR